MIGFGMVGYSNSYGPDHSKTEPLEIRTKWCHFVQISNGFRQNGCHFIQNRTQLETRTALKNQADATIGILSAFGIQTPMVQQDQLRPVLRLL